MKILNFLQENIQKDKKAMLLLVVDSKGSSPGRQGFKMALTLNGEISGSIGGGIMEYNLVEEAKEFLKNPAFDYLIKKQIHQGKIIDGSGLICSGEQTILFKVIDNSHLKTIQSILKSDVGALKITPTSFTYKENETLDSNYRFNFKDKNSWTYTEKVNKKSHLFIVGAGHVGLATSEIFSKLNFEITLIDDRKNLNTLISNRFIDKIIITDYHKIDNIIPEKENTYIVIMTNGFKTDKIVLEKVLTKNIKYIGILGSKAKLKVLFEVLEKSGLTQEQRNNIHAPIGLDIHSQTPSEIAISIAAEIIKIKNS